MQHTGRIRKKSRQKFRKNVRDRGKISITNFFQKYIEGDKVVLKAETAYQKAIYPSKFHGKSGVVKAKRGNCYEVEIKDFNKAKMLVVHPVHLKRIK